MPTTRKKLEHKDVFFFFFQTFRATKSDGRGTDLYLNFINIANSPDDRTKRNNASVVLSKFGHLTKRGLVGCPMLSIYIHN